MGSSSLGGSGTGSSSLDALFPLLLSKQDLVNPEQSQTYAVAKSYIPFLTSSSYEKIC